MAAALHPRGLGAVRRVWRRSTGSSRRDDGSLYDIGLCYTPGWEGGRVGCIDFTNPDAVEVYQRWLGTLFDLGARAIKVDFGEQAPVDGVYHDGTPGHRMHNRYPLLYNRAVAEATHDAHRRVGHLGARGLRRLPAVSAPLGWRLLGPVGQPLRQRRRRPVAGAVRVPVLEHGHRRLPRRTRRRPAHPMAPGRPVPLPQPHPRVRQPRALRPRRHHRPGPRPAPPPLPAPAVPARPRAPRGRRGCSPGPAPRRRPPRRPHHLAPLGPVAPRRRPPRRPGREPRR